jgi:restriction endonuclease S subunit
MDKSTYYPLFPTSNTEEFNRLDYNYNSPKYNRIQKLLSKSKTTRIIPIGNKSSTLIILKNITSGKTPEGIQYLDEGIPFIGATNVLNYHVELDSAPRISPEIHNTTLKTSQIKKNNVLITIAGVGLGRCAVFDSDSECNCNQAVAILELNTEEVKPEYLVYYLNSEIGQLFFGKLQHVADQPNINLEEIKRIMVVLPEKEEQKRIVEKCSPMQTRIFKYQELLQRHKKNFDRPMREALKKDPQDYDRLYESNYYYILPENMEDKRQRLDFVANHPLFNWVRSFRESNDVIPLEKIIVPERFSYGISESACESGDVGFLNVQHLSFEGRILFDPQTFLKNCPPDKRLMENDILIARTGHTLGKAALITEEYAGFSFGSFCIRFSLNSKEYLPDFIAQFINSIYGQAQIMLLKAGAGKNNINQDHIRDIKIPIIDEKQQEKILDSYNSSLTKLGNLEVEQQRLRECLHGEFTNELFGN